MNNPAQASAAEGQRKRRWASWLAVLVLAYLALAYFFLPALWSHHEHEPGLALLPMVTRTSDDIPGDPLNVGLVGDKEDIVRAMHAAGWYAADPVTLRSSIEIIGSVVLDRPYRDAPVSPLYYHGEKEQLAFEKPDGHSADRRNHVRFWKVLDKGKDMRPVWLGSATFDRGVGLSHDTGQVTHHIAPDIDAERDLLMADLRKARVVSSFFQISGIGPTLLGRNGGGDRYYTDGEVHLAVLMPGAAIGPADPATIPPPARIALKDAMWRSISDRVAAR
ncbi:LssY C-terminal domain-containing protein [Bradyrhizobium sp. ISRA442]|uniref:LssY C-terminal domain-containing protein n=1 Tax=Bradyrhizobium sp. ISRA442 TaxID=2866197 RepID=UPI00404A3D72